jgi:hypothetical protein
MAHCRACRVPGIPGNDNRIRRDKFAGESRLRERRNVTLVWLRDWNDSTIRRVRRDV